jgi:hypothetical protein
MAYESTLKIALSSEGGNVIFPARNTQAPARKEASFSFYLFTSFLPKDAIEVLLYSLLACYSQKLSRSKSTWNGRESCDKDYTSQIWQFVMYMRDFLQRS